MKQGRIAPVRPDMVHRCGGRNEAELGAADTQGIVSQKQFAGF
jgi:hypothetical protein